MYQLKYPFSYLFLPFCCFCAVALGSCKDEKKEAPEMKQDKTEVSASQHRMQDEQLAQTYLSRARVEMSEGNYDAARNAIEEMRDTCRLAFDAREKGILLLDSIELLNAEADKSKPDHDTRVEFYRKKLEYDLKSPQKHELKKK